MDDVFAKDETTYSENAQPDTNLVNQGKDQSPDLHGRHGLFAKNEKELETLIQSVRIYSQDIRMEFGIVKCAMLVMKSGKRHMTEGIEIPNQEKVRTLGEKETYKYLEILEADIIKQMEMKEKIKKRVSQKNQKTTGDKTILQETYQRVINTWTVRLVRYSEPFLKWT